MCKKCSLNELEDEKHALMICPAYQEIRKLTFDNVAVANQNFDKLDMENKFMWLLTNEDNYIIGQLSKIINKIMGK